MKFRSSILALIGVLVAAGCARAAEHEFRAVWVHTWRPGLLSPAEIQETVRWARDTNMNALIVQARRVGDAYYNSAYEPRSSSIQAGPDFDPLDCAIKQCRANGLEVHAWFNVYRVWTSNTNPPAGHVVNLHPEWLSKEANGNTGSKDGKFLDPGVPEVRRYLVKLIADLVSKYDIDGLTLDFVRYPGKNWGYNELAVARFNTLYGRTGNPPADDPLWCRWRREQVTETVRAIRREVNRLKPGLKLSAATVSWGPCPSDFSRTDAYAGLFQDWRLWMEQGLLDANMPMNYKDPSAPKHNQYFADWLAGARKWSCGRHVYCGLMVFNSNVSGVAAQVKAAREKGLDGIVGFAFSQADCKSELSSKLRSTVFSKRVRVPPMRWKAGPKRG
ncbi:MAG TPA: family 10 glycosylhydrolase [Armatimonadota bacterium]|nr:family 10 glycosylhydrolase [Armatimonadota bacterium]